MVKIVSVSKITITSLKMMVKSGLDFFFEIPPCGKKVIFHTEFVILGKNLPFYEVGEISKKSFLDHFSPSFLGQKW